MITITPDIINITTTHYTILLSPYCSTYHFKLFTYIHIFINFNYESLCVISLTDLR